MSAHQQFGPSNVGPGRVSSATEGWCPEWRCGEWVCRPVASPGGACGATFSLSLPFGGACGSANGYVAAMTETGVFQIPGTISNKLCLQRRYFLSAPSARLFPFAGALSTLLGFSGNESDTMGNSDPEPGWLAELWVVDLFGLFGCDVSQRPPHGAQTTRVGMYRSRHVSSPLLTGRRVVLHHHLFGKCPMLRPRVAPRVLQFHDWRMTTHLPPQPFPVSHCEAQPSLAIRG
eukprot:gene308-biopygen9120